MNEMLERLAKTLFICHSGGGGMATEIIWQELSKPARNLWYGIAREGFATIREPTEDMIEACGANDYYDSFDLRREHWTTMIDFILKE